MLRVADLEIDTSSHRVTRGSREIALPALEYRLLEYLLFREGEILSKTELSEHLYDYNWEKFSNVIEVYISSIRRKLEENGEPRLIYTIRNQGYVLSSEARKKHAE